MARVAVTSGGAEGHNLSPDAKRTCFVISPIGSQDSAERKRSNQILKHVIRPVVMAAGYDEPLRADGISESGQITRQIISHILEDDLVVADLTGGNPNVYYELALRHAVRKPFVQVLTEGETLPFDIAPQRTIMLDHRDLDSVEAAKVELAAQLSAFDDPEFVLDTPVSVVLDVSVLQSSKDPGLQAQGEILAMLQTLLARSASPGAPLAERRVRPSVLLRRLDPEGGRYEFVNTTDDEMRDVHLRASAPTGKVSFGPTHFSSIGAGKRGIIEFADGAVPEDTVLTATWRSEGEERNRRWTLNRAQKW